MDLKTLEYMGERVDRARDIVERINIHKKIIADLTEKEVYEITFWLRGSQARHDFRGGDFLSAFIDQAVRVLTERQESLQKELDEI
jgi:hypothetical protein